MVLAVNFALGTMIGFIALVLLNLVILLIRVKWFNTPEITHQNRISDSLKWCTFWSKCTLANMVIYVILYAIMVN